MWVVAGVLLGLVSLLGFHLGPHAHLVAVAVGTLAVAWLVLMAVDGRADPLLWALGGTDAAITLGLGALAWRSFSSRGADALAQHVVPLESAEGVAVGDLDPRGTVRVHGETWSAVAVNGTVRSGGAVQVLRVEGVCLHVWGEEAAPGDEPSGTGASTGPSFRLDPALLGDSSALYGDASTVEGKKSSEPVEREVP